MYKRQVYAAASGEIGYSTGPWRITSKNNPSAPPNFGQFVSVWKRQADGVWKVFIDFGISHPGPWLADAWLILSGATHAGADEAAAKSAEKIFSEISEKSGYLEALKRFSAKDGRVYRDGQAPFLGQDAIGKVPSGYAGSGRKSSAPDCQERAIWHLPWCASRRARPTEVWTSRALMRCAFGKLLQMGSSNSFWMS